MAESAGNGAPWWQSRELGVGTGLCWKLGPLELSVLRGAAEIQLAWRSASDDVEAARAEVEPIERLPEAPDSHERYAVGGSSRAVQCRPRLADRAVVVRPRVPLFVPAGERIAIFVSSPAWVEVRAGSPAGALTEVPVKRLSDTWFGSSTRDGELAYSLQTQARTRLEEMSPRGHRAITRVVVHNQASDMLSLDRLNLPVPFLSVYSTEAGHLWTEGVRMYRSSDEELASMQVDSKPPAEAGSVHRLTEPRATPESNVLVRAFSNLLHNLGGDSADG